MSRSVATIIGAGTIRDALRVHYPKGAYAMLEEVRNGTGYGRSERYADALVMSCWPSRGLWLAGVEIKVSRSDWKHELAQPAKSAEIQRWCSYWWIAAPIGVVQTDELPVTWGLLEFDPARREKDKLRVTREAPKLEPEPLSLPFVASVMRNTSEQQARLIEEAVTRRTIEIREECGALAVEELRNELAHSQARVKMLELDRERMQEVAREAQELRSMIGLQWGQEVRHAERALRAARALAETDVAATAVHLRRAAEALDQIQKPEAT